MAELGLTANHSAASRRDAPDAMASTTRSRNSKEHGFGIDPPPKIESVPPDSLIQTIPGNTDSTQVKSALAPGSVWNVDVSGMLLPAKQQHPNGFRDLILVDLCRWGFSPIGSFG
jgi:hypothetical protein